jgi:preprotein translocase subunit SecG
MIDVLLNWVVPMIHVLACFFLIVVVLLQTGKGADIGAVFGGGSQTLFGSGGAGNLLTKLTTGTAILFMVTSLILSYGQGRGSSSSSLLNRLPVEAPAAREAAPTPPAPAAPAPSEQAPPAGGGEGAPAGGQ